MKNNKKIKIKMEYEINQYNITDIKYKDLKGLITCFESSIPLSKISLCNFGPNLMHVKSTENKFPKTKEDKKILRAQANLILSSLNSKDKIEETNFCFSMSNNINKIYLKRILYQINILLQSKNRNKDINNIDENSNKDYKQDIKEIMNFFNLISFFTCIKDEYGDEIPITDYYLSLSVDKNIKYNKLNLIQFNYEYVVQNIINNFQNNNNNDNDFINKNNIHIFYMLIYNLPINELSNYLYCEETKDYFSIFSEEETLDDITKRFIFINQFKLLKNDFSFKCNTINHDEENNNNEVRYNVNAIRTEYNFYFLLFENYLKIKENFLISDEDEKKIFGNYFSILLLSEFDFMHDNLINNIINSRYREFNSNNEKISTNIFSHLRNILVNDMRFNFLSINKNQIDRKRYPYLLSKISYCLGIPEDKILYILMTENNDNKENFSDRNNYSYRDNIVDDQVSIFKNILYLINILYLKGIDNVMEVFSSYNKKKKLTFSNVSSKPRKILNFFLLRSNLIYHVSYEKYLFSNNSFLAISDNFIDSNSFIINQNIREHLYANYIQEKKNYIYLKNSLNMNFDKSFPKIVENSEYLNSIFRDSLNFEEILNVYENEICGLLKLLNIGDISNNAHNFNIVDSKNNFNINHFKVQFNKNISRKNKFEIIDVFNSVNQKSEIFMKVTHTFGVFLYDLNQLFSIDSSNINVEFCLMPNINKEQMVHKLLEYKPYNYNCSSSKYIQENTNKTINSLSTAKKPLYISCLLELNKYNTLTLFDDMKINTIYVYYSNYYNYILNINDIRHYFMQTNNNIIPKNMRNKDNFTIFKHLSKRIRITANDYITDKYYRSRENNIYPNKFRNNRDYGNSSIDYIFVKNKLSNLFGNDRNISLMIYKYNYKQYIQLFCEKLSASKFNYFIYAINGVKAFVKLTKIYKEKLVLSNVRNLITDIIVDNYDIIKEDELKNIKKNEPIFNSLSPINQKLLPKIDNLEELVFDFNKEALGKMLPKLRSNLVHLKRMWQDYINDIIYLTNNISIFYNKECTELVIEQRMINFQILLFLFHKNYKFINSDSVKKYGILVTEFTKTVSNEVLRLLAELRQDFDIFLSENSKININLNELKKNFENITFEKLILKRIELQNIINQKIKEKEGNFVKINQLKMREKNLENKNWNSNGGEENSIVEKNKKFKYNEIIKNDVNKTKIMRNLKENNNIDNNKFKEFTISKKDLNEGRLDNSLRMSKSRKPSARAIESFNTVNRNSQAIYKITSGNNTPKTIDVNHNYSDFEDMNMKSENERYRDKNNNYEYKYDNVTFKNIDESTNRNIKAKIIYTNKQNDNLDENNLNDSGSKYPKNNSNIIVYNRRNDPKNKNNLNNNNQIDPNNIYNNRNYSDNIYNNNNNNQNQNRNNYQNNNRYNQKDNNEPPNYRYQKENKINFNIIDSGEANQNRMERNLRGPNYDKNNNIVPSNNNRVTPEINGVNQNTGNNPRNNNSDRNSRRDIHNQFINKDNKYNDDNNLDGNNYNYNRNRGDNRYNQNNPNNINNDSNNINPRNYNNLSNEKTNMIKLNYSPNEREINNNLRKNNIIVPDSSEKININYDAPRRNNNDNLNPNKDNDNYERDNKSKYKNSYVINSGSKVSYQNQNNNNNNNNYNRNILNRSDKYNNKDNNQNYDENPNKRNIDYNKRIYKNNEQNNDDNLSNKNALDKLNNNDLNNNQSDNINNSPSFSKVYPNNEFVLDRNNNSFQINSDNNNRNMGRNQPNDLNKDKYNQNYNINNDNNRPYDENYNDKDQSPNVDRYRNKNSDHNNNDMNPRGSKNYYNRNPDNNDMNPRKSKNNSYRYLNKSDNISKNPNNSSSQDLGDNNNRRPNNSKNTSNKNFSDSINNDKIPNNKNNYYKNLNNRPNNNNGINEINNSNNDDNYISFKENYNDDKNRSDNNKKNNKNKNRNNSSKGQRNNRNGEDNNNDDYNNEYNKKINLNKDKNYVSWFPDEELQKIYQTLSDINEVGIDKNLPKNYKTYPFDEKNDNLKIAKEIPNKVKKRLNINIVKIMKENQIKKMKSDMNMNILYLKELEKRIKKIKKEINLIDINDSIFEKIEELHFKEENIDETNIVDYKLYNMAEELNKEFYDNIEAKLGMTEEAIKQLDS